VGCCFGRLDEGKGVLFLFLEGATRNDGSEKVNDKSTTTNLHGALVALVGELMVPSAAY
jgi:hypothetical protein